MNTSPAAGNPIGNLSSWYQSQSKIEREVGKKYKAEIAHFNDTFESVAELEGTAFDQDDRPGEVEYRGTGSIRCRSLHKTEHGFKLTTATVSHEPATLEIAASGLPAKPTTTRTEYEINDHTGTIAVLRRQTNVDQPTLTETFVLDTNQGVIGDYLIRKGGGHVAPPGQVRQN